METEGLHLVFQNVSSDVKRMGKCFTTLSPASGAAVPGPESEDFFQAFNWKVRDSEQQHNADEEVLQKDLHHHWQAGGSVLSPQDDSHVSVSKSSTTNQQLPPGNSQLTNQRAAGGSLPEGHVCQSERSRQVNN